MSRFHKTIGRDMMFVAVERDRVRIGNRMEEWWQQQDKVEWTFSLVFAILTITGIIYT